MASLYIHIPFCLKKCLYCSFNSCVAGPDLYVRYVGALVEELDCVAAALDGRPINTVFIGGGTPTVLPSSLLVRIVSHCRDSFVFSEDAEVSVEANPGSVDAPYLESLSRGGVNRLSFGVQSFNDTELSRLGRLHTAKEADAAVRHARNAGFCNINLDLMYGLPGQSVSTWQDTLGRAIDLGPVHLSLYQLSVEENTPFEKLAAAGTLDLPGEDDILAMTEAGDRICGEKGFVQYEISNYSLPGFTCRHNITYWHNDEYYAAGASAVSCVEGCREKRVVQPQQYIAAVAEKKNLIVESERLAKEESFRETVIMGLRLIKGVSLKRLEKRYRIDPVRYYGKQLDILITSGLVELTGGYLRITRKGRPLSNVIMAELV